MENSAPSLKIFFPDALSNCGNKNRRQNPVWEFTKTIIPFALVGYEVIITNSRYALVGYFITSYPTRAHGIIVIKKRDNLKHADFASEWRKLRFRGLEISTFSGEDVIEHPSSNNLDPRQRALQCRINLRRYTPTGGVISFLVFRINLALCRLSCSSSVRCILRGLSAILSTVRWWLQEFPPEHHFRVGHRYERLTR